MSEDGYELVNPGVVDALQDRVASLEAERDTLREALERIRDREPDLSSSDQTAFFWNWAKDLARAALASPSQEKNR
jgi:hypothetical protein